MGEGRPNILWLMTDEQRRDSLGCYGSTWARTPNLDRLAGEGVLFGSAFTQAPVCVPARVSLLTGEYPSRAGVWWNQRHNKRLGHLTEAFAQAGYATASFGKQHYLSSNRAFQAERQIVLGEEVGYFSYAEAHEEADYDVVHYPPKPYAWIFGGRSPAPAGGTGEARAVRAATEWLEQQPKDHPFLLRVSFNGPHTPVVVAEPFDKVIDDGEIALPAEADAAGDREPRWLAGPLRDVAGAWRLTAEQIRRMRRYYYAQVAFLDHQFGILLDWMRARGLLDNTIVAFVSDHGTHLGDYGLVQKQTFYEPVVCVPLLFWYPPAIAWGRAIATPVETRGLLPSLLDLAGVDYPHRFRDATLADVLRTGREPSTRPVFSEFTLESFNIRSGRLVMVRDGHWKLSMCLGGDGADGALYNLADDPYERRNLFDRQGCAKVQGRLVSLIREHVNSPAT